MKTTLSLSAVLAVLVLAGCSSAPKTPPPPKLAPLLSMPSIPAEQKNFIEVNLEFKSRNDLNENTVQLPSHIVKPNSSVVINVPSGLFDDQSKETAKSQDFKTKDFFNEAEQQIERELMKNGFRVLSRSKFEAKLRTLRDESRCEDTVFNCLHSQASPEVKNILDDLKNKFDNGDMDAEKYAEQIKRFKDKLQTASAGRRRSGEEKELTDISEVIRAAESGDVQSDYVLQINLFDTSKKLNISADLRHTKKIRDFIRKNPSIKKEFVKNGNNMISCAVLGSKLNAKLVHVKTGEIAWLGEHQLNEFSSGVQKVTVELGSRKYVSNKNNIKDFVNKQNKHWARISRYGKQVGIPEIKYRYSLIKPTISAGRCEQKWNSSSETRNRLARQVAKELINTIAVSL